MPRVAQDQFDDDEDPEDGGPDLPDRDDPDPADQDDEGDDEPETVPCPYCRRPVYEQAEICPHCKSFISREDAPRHVPWWIWAGVILCLIAVAVLAF